MVNVFIVRAVLNTRTYIFVFSYRVLRTMFVLLTQLVCVCVCGGGEECNSYVFFFHTCLCSCGSLAERGTQSVIRPERVVLSLSLFVRPTLTARILPILYGTKTDRGQGGLRCCRAPVAGRTQRSIGVGCVKIYPCETLSGGRRGDQKKKKKNPTQHVHTVFWPFSNDVAARGTAGRFGERHRGQRWSSAVITPRAGFMDDVLDATNGPGAWRP